MRFLAKRADSAILAEGMVYSSRDSRRLLRMLLDEQSWYCAYTEKRVDGLDAVDVEHFDRTKKNTADDGYYNYYAVLHKWNLRKSKQDKEYEGASFFESRFFQDHQEARRRIRYVAEDHVFEEADPADQEAIDLIDYLGFNDNSLVRKRSEHVERLRKTFDELGWDQDQRLEYLTDNPDERSFITALAAVLGVTVERLLDLSR